MRKLWNRAIIVFLLFFAALVALPTASEAQGHPSATDRPGLKKDPFSDPRLKYFEEVFRLIERNHVAGPSVKSLISGAIEGLRKEAGADRVEGEGTPALRMAGRELQLSITEDAEKSLREFSQAYDFLKEGMPAEQEHGDLVYAAVDGMLTALDPHSHLLRPEIFEEFRTETRGEFSGLGIEITLREDQLMVVAPIEGTPAYRAGLRSRDEIIEIDGVSTRGMNLFESVRRMRGARGTQVTLAIRRERLPAPLSFTLTREVIKIRSVRSNVLEGGVGYIRIRSFLETTGKDLRNALRDLTDQEINGLILDLRNNPGGLLHQAVEVADAFLEKSSLIVSTRARRPDQNLKFIDRKRGPYEEIPLVVLVNSGSASAAEIVSGALQDLDRGLILGRRTFGKGSVQSIIPLSDGSGLRLTTSHYYTPHGRDIHEKGLLPDILIPQPGDNAGEVIRERDLVTYHQRGVRPEDDADRPTRNPGQPLRPLFGSPEDHQLEMARRLLAEHPTADVYELFTYANRELELVGSTSQTPEASDLQADDLGEER